MLFEERVRKCGLQLSLPTDNRLTHESLKWQLLKWIGNKQKFAPEIIAQFPREFGVYYEPFLGSGGVLATLAPVQAVGGDTFLPLVEIWRALRHRPETLKRWYKERWEKARRLGKREGYESILASYNASPNGPDLLFLCRACYGGVVRFRKVDGYMSTPCGIHEPITPDAFAKRVDTWAERVSGTEFVHADYTELLQRADKGDVAYCDPPYSHSQAILYGAQDFTLERLLEVIGDCKRRGVYVALSIDGSKKSGGIQCELPIPQGLFERELFVHLGRSMLRRFQMGGRTLEEEHVHDRLLLTY